MHDHLPAPDEPSGCRDTGWPCHDSCDVRHFELVRQCDVRGLLHCHTSYDGGAHGLREISDTAIALGLEYLGITDRIRPGLHGEGLSPAAVARQREEIEAINAGNPDFRLLHGAEIETEPDGALPVDEVSLSKFDYVVATLATDHGQDPERLTRRAVRAVMNPYVSILGHPFGDYMTMPGELPLDLETVLQAAAQAHVAIEIDAIPAHREPDWRNCVRAQELGVRLVIASDVHRAARLGDYRHGAELTRHAGLCCRQILNTQNLDDLLDFFSRPSC
ncbi:hypothetical protein HGA89_02830 [bacterium]|nr:hypothetical protein [bacterium]